METRDMAEWQRILYGDTDAARAALAYHRERGWPVDLNTFPERTQCEARIYAFIDGYKAASKPTPARAEASEGGDPWQAICATARKMLWSRPESLQQIEEAVDRARAAVEAQHRQEIEALRATNKRLNRRAQLAEAAVEQKVETFGQRSKTALRSFYFEWGLAVGKGERGGPLWQSPSIVQRLEQAEAEIERERQANERTLAEWSALADNLSACSDARSRVEAERDALTAQIAALREALDNRFSLLTDCTPLDEKAATVLAARIDELRKVRAALAATEGGTK